MAGTIRERLAAAPPRFVVLAADARDGRRCAKRRDWTRFRLDRSDLGVVLVALLVALIALFRQGRRGGDEGAHQHGCSCSQHPPPDPPKRHSSGIHAVPPFSIAPCSAYSRFDGPDEAAA